MLWPTKLPKMAGKTRTVFHRINKLGWNNKMSGIIKLSKSEGKLISSMNS